MSSSPWGQLASQKPVFSLHDIMAQEEKEVTSVKETAMPRKRNWDTTQGDASKMFSQKWTPPMSTVQNSVIFANKPKETAPADQSHVSNSVVYSTRVVNLHKPELQKLGFTDFASWMKGQDNVYIGRDMTYCIPGAVGSKWGNPFKSKCMTREECCQKYKAYIKNSTKIQDNGKTLLESLVDLKGKTLGCWCHPDMCHGHMLVELINEYCH